MLCSYDRKERSGKKQIAKKRIYFHFLGYYNRMMQSLVSCILIAIIEKSV